MNSQTPDALLPLAFNLSTPRQNRLALAHCNQIFNSKSSEDHVRTTNVDSFTVLEERLSAVHVSLDAEGKIPVMRFLSSRKSLRTAMTRANLTLRMSLEIGEVADALLRDVEADNLTDAPAISNKCEKFLAPLGSALNRVDQSNSKFSQGSRCVKKNGGKTLSIPPVCAIAVCILAVIARAQGVETWIIIVGLVFGLAGTLTTYLAVPTAQEWQKTAERSTRKLEQASQHHLYVYHTLYGLLEAVSHGTSLTGPGSLRAFAAHCREPYIAGWHRVHNILQSIDVDDDVDDADIDDGVDIVDDADIDDGVDIVDDADIDDGVDIDDGAPSLPLPVLSSPRPSSRAFVNVSRSQRSE